MHTAQISCAHMSALRNKRPFAACVPLFQILFGPWSRGSALWRDHKLHVSLNHHCCICCWHSLRSTWRRACSFCRPPLEQVEKCKPILPLCLLPLCPCALSNPKQLHPCQMCRPQAPQRNSSKAQAPWHEGFESCSPICKTQCLLWALWLDGLALDPSSLLSQASPQHHVAPTGPSRDSWSPVDASAHPDCGACASWPSSQFLFSPHHGHWLPCSGTPWPWRALHVLSDSDGIAWQWHLCFWCCWRWFWGKTSTLLLRQQKIPLLFATDATCNHWKFWKEWSEAFFHHLKTFPCSWCRVVSGDIPMPLWSCLWIHVFCVSLLWVRQSFWQAHHQMACGTGHFLDEEGSWWVQRKQKRQNASRLMALAMIGVCCSDPKTNHEQSTSKKKPPGSEAHWRN